MESMKLPVREKWGEQNMNLKLCIHNQILFGRFLTVCKLLYFVQCIKIG